MHFCFLDELGHIGPFISRSHPRYNASPVFGMGGMILPEDSVRPFAMWFFQLKNNLLGFEIKKARAHPATWEKKGTSLFTAKAVRRYPAVRGAGKRIINRISAFGGHVFYYGREKYQSATDSHAVGLHKTVLSHCIRRVNALCAQKRQYFMMILDQHSSRADLLETAAKTMFGDDPAPRLLEPPFEVESHLYQTAQAADWIAAILGHLWAYRLRPVEYHDLAIFETFFGRLIDGAASHSAVERIRPRVTAAPVPLAPSAAIELGNTLSATSIDPRLGAVVENLVTSLPTLQVTMLKSVFSVQRGVPPEIDGRMLAISRNHFGRDLTAEEKRAARDKLFLAIKALP
jgi:hypothetical protein